MPAGTTGIPSNTVGLTQVMVSRLCASGYAVNDAESGNYFCGTAPFNPAGVVGKGQASGFQCSVTVTPTTGAATVQNTILAQCGYNQDAMFYCPYALGDAPVQAMLQAINSANLWGNLNKNCNPNTQNCAWASSVSPAVQIALNQF